MAKKNCCGIKSENFAMELLRRDGFYDIEKIKHYHNFKRPLPDLIAWCRERRFIIEVKSWKSTYYKLQPVFIQPEIIDIIFVVDLYNGFYAYVSPKAHFTGVSYSIHPKNLYWKKAPETIAKKYQKYLTS